MPVEFLTAAQREGYCRYTSPLTKEELAKFFHLTDDDRAFIANRRGEHNRLGFALQFTTVRFLGVFLEDAMHVPTSVMQHLGRQLEIKNLRCINNYRESQRRWAHAAEIRARYGYREFTDHWVALRLSRWLYALCWTGTERPIILFERATSWLLAHKVLLPGCTVVERFICRLRSRAEDRLWRLLGQGITAEQEGNLMVLLEVPEGRRSSLLDRLRTGHVTITGPSLVLAINRLQTVRDLGISLPSATRIPSSRIAALARFAHTATLTAITRLPMERRLATLVAFVHCLEATAHDDVLEVLEVLLQNLFGNAEKKQKKARLRTLKDLDKAANVLAQACKLILDQTVPDDKLRDIVFTQTPNPVLEKAVQDVNSLTRPSDDVYFEELKSRYRSVRIYLPT